MTKNMKKSENGSSEDNYKNEKETKMKKMSKQRQHEHNLAVLEE